MDLTNNGRGITKLQQQAYFSSKSYWKKKEREDAKKNHSQGHNGKFGNKF